MNLQEANQDQHVGLNIQGLN